VFGYKIRIQTPLWQEQSTHFCPVRDIPVTFVPK
jgi:hypothetical protein